MTSSPNYFGVSVVMVLNVTLFVWNSQGTIYDLHIAVYVNVIHSIILSLGGVKYLTTRGGSRESVGFLSVQIGFVTLK